jgi:oxygen-independent coproporphyrinogen-3 oxidase
VSLGIYISVPFCRTKCSYCNFASDVFSRAVFDRYVERVCADLEKAPAIAREVGGQIEGGVDSVYLGGGTPTVLATAHLEQIFATARANLAVQTDAEITVECAPGTLTQETLDALLRCGVNRVSLGVQSFVDREAAAVGRLHKRTTVLEDISRLRAAGITNLNVDLIAGLPHQTAESWNVSLQETIATDVPHVSVYMLEVDEDSRLGRELLAGGTRYHAHFVPDDGATADFYLAACEQLDAAGVPQYEISNFARNGFQSRHNLKYWTRQPYLGFGVDAHSMLEALGAENGSGSTETPVPCAVPARGSAGFRRRADEPDAVRFATPDSLDGYLAAQPLIRTPVACPAAIEETFFLGLRLNQGVDLEKIEAKFGKQGIVPFLATIGEFAESGLLERRGKVIRLTPRGRLLSNEVFERFVSVAGGVS